jgi:hypothetical protein
MNENAMIKRTQQVSINVLGNVIKRKRNEKQKSASAPLIASCAASPATEIKMTALTGSFSSAQPWPGAIM